MYFCHLNVIILLQYQNPKKIRPTETLLLSPSSFVKPPTFDSIWLVVSPCTGRFASGILLLYKRGHIPSTRATPRLCGGRSHCCSWRCLEFYGRMPGGCTDCADCRGWVRGERVTVVHGHSWCGLTSWKPRETKRNGSVVALVLMDRTVNHVGPRVTVARSSVAKKSWHGLNCWRWAEKTCDVSIGPRWVRRFCAKIPPVFLISGYPDLRTVAKLLIFSSRTLGLTVQLRSGELCSWWLSSSIRRMADIQHSGLINFALTRMKSQTACEFCQWMSCHVGRCYVSVERPITTGFGVPGSCVFCCLLSFAS